MGKSTLEKIEEITSNQKSMSTSRLSKLLIDLRKDFEAAQKSQKKAFEKMNEANKRVQIVEARNQKLKEKLEKRKVDGTGKGQETA